MEKVFFKFDPATKTEKPLVAFKPDYTTSAPKQRINLNS